MNKDSRIYANRPFQGDYVAGSICLFIDDEEIITTPSHPFYVKDRGFVPAAELSEHSVLVDSEGNELHLQKPSVLKKYMMEFL